MTPRRSTAIRGCFCVAHILLTLTCAVAYSVRAQDVEQDPNERTAQCALRASDYTVDAIVSQSHVSGSVTIEVANADVARECEGTIWFYPARLALPIVVDELRARWIFPGEATRASVSMQSTDTAACSIGAPEVSPVFGERRSVRCPPGEHAITLSFAFDLVGRFGRVGSVAGIQSLLAPWYPLLGDSTGALEATNHRVHLRATGSDIVTAGAASSLVHARDEVRIAVRGAYVPAAIADEFHVDEQWHDGTLVRLLSWRALAREPQTSPDIFALHDLSEVYVPNRVNEVAESALRGLSSLDAHSPVRAARVPRVVNVMLFPSRTELASTAPGLVVASDRLFQILPLREARSFHDNAFSRAIFRYAVDAQAERMPLSASEPPSDVSWASDLRAFYWSERARTLVAGQRAFTTEQLLGFAAFHPTVDQLLYAPQIAFVEDFFGPVETRVPAGENPMRSFRVTPPPERLNELLNAVLSDAERTALIDAAVAGHPLRGAFAGVSASSAGRIDEWLSWSTRRVNYRLGAIETRTERNGETRFVHRITVHRDGADRREPVVLEVLDSTGATTHATWDDYGAVGVVEVRTRGSLTDVRIDPEGHLAQSPSIAEGNPRIDDATSLPFRPPILQGVYGAWVPSESRFDGYIDVAIRRRYDIDRAFAIRLFTEAAGLGGSLRYLANFGPKLDDNRRIGVGTAGIEVVNLRPGFAGMSLGGVAFSATGVLGFNTQYFRQDPRSGWAFAIGGRVGAAYRDTGTWSFSASASARGSVLIPMGLQNTLLLLGSAGFVVGDPLPGENQEVGGSLGLRGYQAGELIGRARAYAVAEHRYTPITNLAINVAHLVWLREVQLAAFVGGGVLGSAIDGRSLVGAFEVGAGVRFHYEYVGVQPGVLTLDFGFPLLRDPTRNSHAPFSVRIGFDQYF